MNIDEPVDSSEVLAYDVSVRFEVKRNCDG